MEMERAQGLISAIFTGKLYRRNHLPNSILNIRRILQKHTIELCKTNNDGRINSCMDEDKIIQILSNKLGNRIHIPDARMWYDILVSDFQYGWLPVNIKTTTTITSDNTGNLAMCVYSYTDEPLDLYTRYNNGDVHRTLSEKIRNREFNYKNKKDYYFVVVNKNNSNDIIVNSIKGLDTLTPNINNLPFQVRWDRNRIFNYKPITECVNMFIEAIKRPKPGWREPFLHNMRELEKV